MSAAGRNPLVHLSFGYRIAALIGGALALVLSEAGVVAGGLCEHGRLHGTDCACDAGRPGTPRDASEREQTCVAPGGAIEPRLRAIGLIIVGLGWLWALWTVGSFMVNMLGGGVDPVTGKPPAVGDFTKAYGPWIVAATVILPAVVAAVFNWLRARKGYILKTDEPATGGGQRAADHAYSALILPLGELVRRIGWGVIIVLGLILSYRITDNIWGSFAFPFYLQELKYTGDEVAFASKIFGVFMTMAGIAIGAAMFATIGRMPTLLIGAIVAAASNLIYADLASGAVALDAFARFFALDTFGRICAMVRLLIAISARIAGGLEGGVSSPTSRRSPAASSARCNMPCCRR